MGPLFVVVTYETAGFLGDFKADGARGGTSDKHARPPRVSYAVVASLERLSRDPIQEHRVPPRRT